MLLMKFYHVIEQEKLFKVAGVPMVENCVAGYNSCMFAYGQVSVYAWLSNVCKKNWFVSLFILFCIDLCMDEARYFFLSSGLLVE